MGMCNILIDNESILNAGTRSIISRLALRRMRRRGGFEEYNNAPVGITNGVTMKQIVCHRAWRPLRGTVFLNIPLPIMTPPTAKVPDTGIGERDDRPRNNDIGDRSAGVAFERIKVPASGRDRSAK